MYRHYRPDLLWCIFFESSCTHLEVVFSSVALRDDPQTPSAAKGPQFGDTNFLRACAKTALLFTYMQLYALLLLWLLTPRTTHNWSQLSLSTWKQLCYTVIMINTLIRTFTNASRRLFKSMHFMHRWWSSSEACEAPLWRQRVECILHVQPLSSQFTRPFRPPPPQPPRRAVNLLHLALSSLDWSILWIAETIHKIPCASRQTLLSVSYCYSQVVFEQCYTTISPQRCALPTLHVTLSSLSTTFSPLFPQYFTNFFLLVDTKLHGTLDEYKTGLSLHFSL